MHQMHVCTRYKSDLDQGVLWDVEFDGHISDTRRFELEQHFSCRISIRYHGCEP